MRRILRLLLISTQREILQWLAWRPFLLTMLLNQAVGPLIGLAVWSVALPGNTRIGIYYVALLAVQLMTVSYENHTVSNTIYDGTFSQALLKPQPVMLGPLGTNIALRLWHFLFGLPLLLLVSIVEKISWDVRLILLALPALLFAAILRFLITYVLALSAFWTEQAHGIVGLNETLIFLLGGASAPIIFLPPSFRAIGEALPFRALLGFPAEIMSASLDTNQILRGYGWQMLWLIMFWLLVTVIWRAGIRRYTAIGG
ncbi:ABC-2 family transporter protein [Ktedonospora formicarum]|uniref:ABC transporter permease n=1 Tax=Ktedonospora formicarum TaxID=2778364 RepID=A0A8J3MUF3_9CHLR|nr:ABC-2 family transporter protein [Ktedonospora formicarum]GHO49287.1 ABC transporter permease [Ktedonospora formicarum]